MNQPVYQKKPDQKIRNKERPDQRSVHGSDDRLANLETNATVPAIEVHDLTVAYRKRPVLWDVDLKIPQGSLVGLAGPNGAGKTTLLKTIMGILAPLSGNVKILGERGASQIGKIGYVPQRESVDWDFPTDALDVTLMGRYGKMSLFGRPKKADIEFAMQCLQDMGMADYAKRQISQLSGGQQQRVFLARALAQEAPIYLMDEPLAGVDATTEKAVIEILRKLRAQSRTVVVVHHDLQTAGEYFDHMILLNMRLVAFGKTEDVFTEENIRATYGGQLTILSTAAQRVREEEITEAHPETTLDNSGSDTKKDE
ncbi:MAG: metal ABC transporter ATP-binding protein [candidate division Zixibacteria bacterium]|nr:metal ABC transporter ATP-binding protein [candidate division Zixibacteria bacterium]